MADDKPKVWDIIIVGGGTAGLQAGLRARFHEKSCLILEARDKLGGRAETERTYLPDLCKHEGASPPIYSDHGPSYYGDAHTYVASAVQRYGLNTWNIGMNDFRVKTIVGDKVLDDAESATWFGVIGLSKDGDVPLSEQARMMYFFLSVWAIVDLIDGLKPTTNWLTGWLGRWLDGMSLADALNKFPGRPDWVYDLAYSGWWGALSQDPEKMSGLYALWYMKLNGAWDLFQDGDRSPQQYVLKKGMADLIHHMELEFLGKIHTPPRKSSTDETDILTGHAVTHIDFEKGSEVTITAEVWESGRLVKKTFLAKQVVVCTPPIVTNKITFRPDLPEHRRVMFEGEPGFAIKSVVWYDRPPDFHVEFPHVAPQVGWLHGRHLNGPNTEPHRLMEEKGICVPDWGLHSRRPGAPRVEKSGHPMSAYVLFFNETLSEHLKAAQLHTAEDVEEYIKEYKALYEKNKEDLERFYQAQIAHQQATPELPSAVKEKLKDKELRERERQEDREKQFFHDLKEKLLQKVEEAREPSNQAYWKHVGDESGGLRDPANGLILYNHVKLAEIINEPWYALLNWPNVDPNDPGSPEICPPSPAFVTVKDWQNEPFIKAGPITAMKPGQFAQIGTSFHDTFFDNRLAFASSEHALQFTGYVEGAMRAGQHAVDKLLFPNDAREVRDDLAWKIKKGIVDLVRGPEENGLLTTARGQQEKQGFFARIALKMFGYPELCQTTLPSAFLMAGLKLGGGIFLLLISFLLKPLEWAGVTSLIWNIWNKVFK